MRIARVVISVVILFIAGCTETEVLRSSVIVMGHAGAGFPNYNNRYPTNSEESIKQALLMQQADGVEIDIQLSADSTIVLYHDKRLESGCNDTGFISAQSWVQLSKLHRRMSNSIIDESSKLWRLEDLLKFLENHNLDIWLSLNIQNQYEVKDQFAYNNRFGRALSNTLKNYSGKLKVMVETSDIPMLKQIRSLSDNNHARLFLTQRIDTTTLNDLDGIISGVVTHYLDETEETMALAKSKQLEVSVYGIKIRQDIRRALSLNPNYVQTDNIPLMLDYLK